MRRLIGGLAVGFLGLSLGWAAPAATAADSCSLNGTYNLDGLGEAAGFLEAVGALTFTPNPPCTSGSVGGSITLRRQGQPPDSFSPVGTYSVSSAGAVALTLPGVIDMVGFISLEGGGGTIANSVHLGAAFTAPQVFSATGTRTPPLIKPQDLTCPPDAVRSGPTCIDKYEASVWEIPPDNAALIAKVRQGTATLADLTAAGAVRFPLMSTEPATTACPVTGNGCKDAYAVSIPGVTPSRQITWFQAAAAARNAGKRLPTNAEWQAAALGTEDPGGAPGPNDCNTAHETASIAGGRAGCVSDVGAFDMIGNVWEWVADWAPLSTSCAPAPLFAGDRNCLAGASTTAGPGALIRGGDFISGMLAGVFAVDGRIAPSSAPPGSLIGFRAAR